MLKTPRQLNPVVELIDELVRLNGRLKSIFSGVNASTGLSPMDATVLTAVVESHVAPTVPQIGRSLGNPRQVIQRSANSLISAGLIETAPNPNHKRAPLLIATRQGKNLKHKADTLAVEMTSELLLIINAGKCRRIASEIRELRSQIEDYLRSIKAK